MLVLKEVSFAYDKKEILKNINFSLKQGEILSVIGVSGCGKSTLLKSIYGLFDIGQGSIHWNEELITGPSHNLVPGHQKMKYLAQDFGLMPYISVAENVGTFLSNLDLPKKRQRIQQLLQMVNMQDFANEKPLNLSGGQQQRTALAMALAKEPELLLLDEPFSQIDTFQKNELRRNLFSYLKQRKITCIIATHDSSDALAFSDYIMVMQEGQNLLMDTPEKVYYQSKKQYIASLFDEVSVIKEKNKMFFPWQISITQNSPYTAKVINSYFQGGYYLIECLYQNEVIFANHSQKIAKGSIVSLYFE